MSSHCLVCNLCLGDVNTFVNVFSSFDYPQNKLANVECTATSLFDAVVQILDRPLSSVILHSQVLCQNCYSKVKVIAILRDKLQNLQTDFISSFDQTAFTRTESSISNDVFQGKQETTELLTSQTDLNDPKPKEPSVEVVRTDVAGMSLVDLNLSIKEEKKYSPQVQGQPIDNFVNVEKQYVCEKCGEIFTSNDEWVEHMLVHLDTKANTCSICKKSFKSLSALKVHERTHKGIKPYECDKCGKSFSERHYLTEHGSVHTDHKPFKCSVCDRDFARRKDMMTHTKLHSAERPHGCPHCPKRFVVKSRLNRHLKTHSVDRPHQCKICQKTFVRQNDFQIHERLHTGEKPYKCAYCNKTFSSLSNFRAHERRHKASQVDTTNPSTLSDPLGDNPADPLEIKLFSSVDGKATPVSEKLTNLVQSHNSSEGIDQSNQEIISGTEAVIFPAEGSQPDEATKAQQHSLPSLVSFRNPSEGIKASEPSLPISVDLSNVTLQNGESNISPQQPYVLMQFPLLPEPPPLVLYSAPRNSDQTLQLANSMIADTPNSTLSQVQVLRWDNNDDVDMLLHDNTNGSMLSQGLFHTKEVSDAFST